MDGPFGSDDRDEDALRPASRLRRAATLTVLVILIVSMIVLAFISGRGVVTVPPAPLPTATAVATDPGLPRLAVVDASGRLRTMDAGGGSIATYGPPDVAFTFPAWSPDGKRVASIGQDARDTAVYVFTVPPDGHAPADAVVIGRSADHPPFYLYWSPDGTRLTYLTTEPTGLALQIAAADASSAPVAIRQGAPLYWAWAGADRLVVHSGNEGIDGFIGEVRLDGSSIEPRPLDAGTFRAPGVTADGRFRAYTSPGLTGTEQVIVESTDRSGQHGVDVFGGAALGFRPSGGDLAFIAPAAAGPAQTVPEGPLRIMDAATGSVRTLLTDGVVAFFWSPDGDTIAALQVVTPGDDSVATGGGIVLAASRHDAVPTVVPAAEPPGVGLRLVFVTEGSAAIRSRRSVRVSDAFASQLLPYFDQYALSHRIWSPDTLAILLPIVSADGAVHLTSFRADGSDPQPVTDGVAGFWSP